MQIVGLVHVGKPSIHLHELLCLALYLDAPIALSDATSYDICKKFSSIIPVFLLSKDFSFNLFISGLTELYTNLQPQELAPFFHAHPEAHKLQVKHLVEEGVALHNVPAKSIFCSSFPHTKQLIPIANTWINLGPIGPLSYQKHKKAIRNILTPFFPKSGDCQFFMTQVLQNIHSKKLNSEDTLDQIQFATMAFSGFETSTSVIPAHGLLDAAIDITKACIVQEDSLVLLTLHHKKPMLLLNPMQGMYEDLSPLTSMMPKEARNLVPLVDNYFEFETMDREEMIKRCYHKFFNKSCFST